MPGRSPDRERFPLPPPLNKLSAIIGRVCLAAYQRYLLSLFFFSFLPFLSFFLSLSSSPPTVEKPLFLERSRASRAGSIRSSASLRLFVDRVFFFFFYASEITRWGGEREREREERKKFVFESRGERLRRKDERRIFYRPEVDVRRGNRKSFERDSWPARLARQLFTRYSLLDHSSEPRTCERVHVRYREGEKEGVGRGVLFDAALI